MKKFSMLKYIQDLKEATQQYEEDLITELEYLYRIHALTTTQAYHQANKLEAKQRRLAEELKLAKQILN